MERVRVLGARLKELESNVNKNEAEINAIINELSATPMNVAILQATLIGASVNRVRKLVNEQLGQRMLQLVGEWRDLVRKSQEQEGASSSPPAAASASASPPSNTSSFNPKSTVSSSPTAASTPTADLGKRKLSSADSERDELAKKVKVAHQTANAASTSKSTTAAKSSSSSSSSSSSTLASKSQSSSSSTSKPKPTIAPSPPKVNPFIHQPPPTFIETSSLTNTTGPIFYNPNITAYQLAAKASLSTSGSSAATSETVYDPTSRKKTIVTGGMNIAPTDVSTSSTPVNLCSLESMCCDYVSHHLTEFDFFDAIPVPIILRLLAKATPEQLQHFEAHNPRLLGETESLWEKLCYKTLIQFIPNKSAASTWKQFYMDSSNRKAEKYQELAARFKAATQAAEREKKEIGVKTINMAAAIRIESARKPVSISSSSFTSSNAHAAASIARGAGGGKMVRPTTTAQPSKLAQIKKQANAVSNIKYALKRS